MAIYKRQKAVIAGCAILISLMMLAGLFFPVKVFAVDDNSVTVKVGYYENEVFQEGAGQGSVKTGYAYEYYQKLSEYTGWHYEYVYGGFSELYQKLLDGDIDVLAGLAWKKEREELIGYPDLPMGNETYNLIKHIDDGSITVDAATLEGKRIGVLNSAMADSLKAFLQDHSVQAEVALFDDYDPLFKAFDDNEVDVLAVEGDGAYGRANAELLYAFGASDYFLCVSKNRADLLTDLNIAQTELSVDEPNYINFLRSKYYPVSISSRAFSEHEKQWLDGHDSLRIGYLNNYLPYSGTDSEGEVNGLLKDLIPRMLKKLGCNVQVLMTENATNFINPITFETLTSNRCFIDTFDRNFQYSVEHVALAKQADVVMIAPADANVIGKIANGIADDMLTTTVMACPCRKLVAPAMNHNMYHNPIVQDNLKKLADYGYGSITPDTPARCRSSRFFTVSGW